MLNTLKREIGGITFDDNSRQDYSFSFVMYIEIVLFYTKAGPSWRSLPAANTMTAFRHMLPVRSRLQLHQR